MSNSENENMTEQSVISIAKSNNQLKAIELIRHDGTIEVIRTKDGEENVINWQEFASECGLSTDMAVPDGEIEHLHNIVVGYDSAGIAFSRVNIPVVEDKELESMVQLQAESRLPLPADQMELAWRADRDKDELLEITIAAARRQQIQAFINKIISFRPLNIFLDCEGIVKAWKEVFSGDEKNSVIIINTGNRNTQICLTNQGRLINVVSLDMGIADFSELGIAEQDEAIERFVQDTRSVVDLFGIDKAKKLPVVVLSDGSEIYTSLVSALNEVGLETKSAKPNINKFSSKSNLSVKDIFDYRLQIGLALMASDVTGNELNLFKELYKPYGEEKEKHWLYSPKISGTIAAAVLLIFMFVVYTVDAIQPNVIQKRIEEASDGQELEDLVKRQVLLEQVQKQRPDLLELINIISLNNNERNAPNSNDRQSFSLSMMGGRNNTGIQLQKFEYKKGKKITITGQATTNETLYNFEEQLSKKPGISQIEWQAQNRSSSRSSSSSRTNSSSRNRNSGGLSYGSSSAVPFQMSFHYKNFTKGKSR